MPAYLSLRIVKTTDNTHKDKQESSSGGLGMMLSCYPMGRKVTRK